MINRNIDRKTMKNSILELRSILVMKTNTDVDFDSLIDEIDEFVNKCVLNSETIEKERYALAINIINLAKNIFTDPLHSDDSMQDDIALLKLITVIAKNNSLGTCTLQPQDIALLQKMSVPKEKINMVKEIAIKKVDKIAEIPCNQPLTLQQKTKLAFALIESTSLNAAKYNHKCDTSLNWLTLGLAIGTVLAGPGTVALIAAFIVPVILCPPALAISLGVSLLTAGIFILAKSLSQSSTIYQRMGLKCRDVQNQSQIINSNLGLFAKTSSSISQYSSMAVISKSAAARTGYTPKPQPITKP